MKQTRVRKTRSAKRSEDSAVEPLPSSKAESRVKATEDSLNDLLDEIDSVLEENAEEFVKSYVQRGGE